MKKCPFCAEEIQDEAIKCKHCGSMLNEPPKPPPPSEEEVAAAKKESAAAEPAPRRPLGLMAAGSGKARAPHPDDEKTFIYEGSPSWRAFFSSYLMVGLLTPAIAAGALVAVRQAENPSGLLQALAVLVPLAAGVVAFFTLGLVRKADRVRMTNRSVEHEEGVFSKKIEVLELWRIRDVRYRQSLLDRLLGIAHIDVFSKDVTTPHLEVVGLPASREVFEKLRDSIEIQRQSHRVMGIID